jgi:hypothetical protein
VDLFNLEEQQEAAKEKPADWTGVICVLLTLPVIIHFSHIGKFDMGLNIAMCLGLNMMVIKFRMDLWRRIWFWVVAILVPAIEIPFIYRIQWPHRWVPKVELMPIGLAAVMIMIGAISLAEKIMGKVSPPDAEERDDV